MIKVPENIRSFLSLGYQIQPSELTFLGGGRIDSDGITYTFNKNGENFVLKILAFPVEDRDAIICLEERLKFVHFLGDRGAPIVNPLERPDGSLFVTQTEEGHLFVAYSYPKILGGTAGETTWLDPIARPWGAAVGVLHHLTQEYPNWQSSPVTGTDRSVLGWREEWQGFYDWCRDKEVRECWQSIRERLEALPASRDSFGFIHNDPHSGNIIITPTRIFLLDFDVANYHWFINDIAITLQSLLYRQTGGLDRPLADAAPLHQFMALFMEGYGWENSLDPFWLSQIDLFIAYRRILGFIVMQDWLKTKPSFRRAWKSMIMDEPRIFG